VGAALGTPIPIAGTVVGFFIGAAAGFLFDWLYESYIQS
jgi:hypothetical protein